MYACGINIANILPKSTPIAEQQKQIFKYYLIVLYVVGNVIN